MHGFDRRITVGMNAGFHLHRLDCQQQVTLFDLLTRFAPQRLAITPGIGAPIWFGVAGLDLLSRLAVVAAARRFGTRMVRGCAVQLEKYANVSPSALVSPDSLT